MTDHSNVSEVRLGALDKAVPIYNQTRPVEFHSIASSTAGNYAYPGTGTKYDLKGLKLQLSFAATAVALAAAGAVITVTFYEYRDGVYYLINTQTTTNPTVAAGAVGVVSVNSTARGATHFSIAGTIVVAAGSTVSFAYALYEETVAAASTTPSGTITAIGASEPTNSLGVYSNIYGDFTHAALAANKTITIAWVIAAPFVLAANNVRRVQRVSAAGVRTEVPLSTVTVAGLVITLADAADFVVGETVNVWLEALPATIIRGTNSQRDSEISPLDTRDVLISAIASNATINNTALYYPAAAATPTSNWDSFSLNANGGKATRISFNGSSIPPNTKTAIITMYASNDPNATSANKRWTQVAFNDDVTGTTVTSLTMTGNAGGTAQPFAVSTPQSFDFRYLVMLVTTNDNTTAVYIDGAAGY